MSVKILYDLSSAQPQGQMKINGGGGYAMLVFRKTVEKLGADAVEVLFNANNPDNDEMLAFCLQNGITVNKFASIDDFNRHLCSGKYQTLVLPVCYPEYHGLKVDRSIRVISVIHDLCHVYEGKLRIPFGEYPKNDGLNWLRKIRNHFRAARSRRAFLDWHNRIIALNDNQTVVTVTAYSKCAMLHYLNFTDPDKIRVFYSPIKKFGGTKADIAAKALEKYSLTSGKYFMLSSTCRSTKNNAIALFTLDKMFSDPKYATILEGYRVIALGTDELFLNYFKRKLQNPERFVFESYVEMPTLSALYENAHLFIFPSLLEGFGLPPVEAMQCGTVPACSTAMSIPEVCGDAAIYFDPRDEESILLSILKSLDPHFMAQMRAAGKKRSDELLKRGNDELERLVDLIG